MAELFIDHSKEEPLEKANASPEQNNPYQEIIPIVNYIISQSNQLRKDNQEINNQNIQLSIQNQQTYYENQNLREAINKLNTKNIKRNEKWPIIIQNNGEMYCTYQDSQKYQRFSDGTIINAIYLQYDPAFKKEDAFIFEVRNRTGEEHIVEIAINELSSKKILQKFRVQGNLSFFDEPSSTKKAEAFVNFLLQIPRTEIFVPYHNGWQINSGEKVCYQASSNKKDCLDYHYPLGWKFLAPVSDNSYTALNQLFNIFQEPTTPLILILWLHYGIMYTFFDAAHGEIHMPLYLIGENDLSIEIVQYILQIFDCE